MSLAISCPLSFVLIFLSIFVNKRKNDDTKSEDTDLSISLPIPTECNRSYRAGNMGFVDSYTNSNHGGSVNSQESLWQKAAAGVVEAMSPLDRQSYEYDAVAHAGYRADEFAQYSRLPHQPAEYLRSQNPSRQEYCSDPYASVHKPKKPRRDQHIGELNVKFALSILIKFHSSSSSSQP